MAAGVGRISEEIRLSISSGLSAEAEGEPILVLLSEAKRSATGKAIEMMNTIEGATVSSCSVAQEAKR